MEPASDALLSQFERMNINQPLVVRVLQPLPAIDADQDQLVSKLYAKILPSFQPHITDKGTLARIRRMHPQPYHASAPPQLFTQDEAEAVCAVVAKSLSMPLQPGNYVVSRKVSKKGSSLTFRHSILFTVWRSAYYKGAFAGLR